MSFKAFAQLVDTLGKTTRTTEKVQALQQYFGSAPDADKVWTIALFTGRRPRRFVSGPTMAGWCMALAGVPGWLFTECYGTVGDMSETMALLLPAQWEPAEAGTAPTAQAPLLLSTLLEDFGRLHAADEAVKKAYVLQRWHGMSVQERFVFNKLLSANFRVGVSAHLVVQALAVVSGLPEAEVTHRISGHWDAAAVSLHTLLYHTNAATDLSKPYPFYLAYPLESAPAALGPVAEWQAEWKWDGIRGQLIKRGGQWYAWSRGEELVTDKFPELAALCALLPDGTCLDGEIVALPPNYATVAWQQPAPFAALQKRIGRKNLSRKILAEHPAGFIAYDLLEWQGHDLRQQPLQERRRLLEALYGSVDLPGSKVSAVLAADGWEELVQARSRSRAAGAEGLMLKRLSAPYGTGRRRGDWWKWKTDPLSIDAVLIYAQKGSGRRSNLYTDYTFAVRDGDKLVPFAKAYSGLTDKEIAQVDAFVKKNALEKFGPVRTVKPELVFEIGFEGIAESTRHKSGVALRFPRMLRWRHDKGPEDIGTLEELRAALRFAG